MCRTICSSQCRSAGANRLSGFMSSTRPAGRPLASMVTARSDRAPNSSRVEGGGASRFRTRWPVRRSHPKPPFLPSLYSQHRDTSMASVRKVSDRAGDTVSGPAGSLSAARTFHTKIRSSSSSRIARQACSHPNSRINSPSAWRIDSVKPRSNCNNCVTFSRNWRRSR